MWKFYYKPNKKIEPLKDEKIEKLALFKLEELYNNAKDLLIPSDFLNNWDKVALYDPKGNVAKANAILISPEKGGYNLKNKLNDLTGKEWIKFTCSWFVFNALKSDLDQEKELTTMTENHPATFSPTMISDFIKFFTKENQIVFDPFMGIGSTAEACARTNRIAYGTELNYEYYKIAIRRSSKFKDTIYNHDALKIKELNLPNIDFSISSPPYWDILNRSTHKFRNEREKKSLDSKYSDDLNDLGNIDDYDNFLNLCSKVYFDIFDLLKPKAYVVIIIKNVKKNGKFYPLAWDLAKKLTDKYELKDEKIWIQDKVALAPYGYPFAWTSNILHHYCLILRKN